MAFIVLMLIVDRRNLSEKPKGQTNLIAGAGVSLGAERNVECLQEFAGNLRRNSYLKRHSWRSPDNNEAR